MERQVIKPEYRPISEEEAKRLLKEGRARKTSDIPARLFTLYVTVAVFLALVFGAAAYYKWIADPHFIKPLAIEKIAETDSSLTEVQRQLLDLYGSNPHISTIETLAREMISTGKRFDSKLGLAVLQQLIAQKSLGMARVFSAPAERWIGENEELRFELFWLKANIAYQEKNFEETRFYLVKLTEKENRFFAEAKKVVEEIDELLDDSIWPELGI